MPYFRRVIAGSLVGLGGLMTLHVYKPKRIYNPEYCPIIKDSRCETTTEPIINPDAPVLPIRPAN